MQVYLIFTIVNIVNIRYVYTATKRSKCTLHYDRKCQVHLHGHKEVIKMCQVSYIYER